jgi:voltage-dependent potassium channel beta subunit
MEYRFLGNSGLKVSALSFGAWVTFGDQIEEDVASACMKVAYEAGVNFFDNAEVYAQGRAETMMGSIIKKMGWKRSDLVLSTKIFWGGNGPNDQGLSRKHILEGTEAALRRLQTDYVDLIFCHRADFDTPIEETVRAMNHLINHGKALYWGTSEWSAEQIHAAYHIAREEHLIPPTMEQPEYLSLYKEIGLGTTIWSPLASGLLTGKYNKGIPKGTRVSLTGYEWLRQRFESEEGRRKIEKVLQLSHVAEDLQTTLPKLAIAWCLKNPHISTVITGASKPEQVSENMTALDVVPKLTEEVLDLIEHILDNKPTPEPRFR